MDSTGVTRLIRSTELIARNTDTVRTYYHYASDEMGSTTHIVDETGEVQNRYEYDAWGNLTLCEEKISNRFKFTGQQLDPITQQYYLRARFYNPVIARFTQEDTYRGDGLNLYAYCANNPVYYIDPSGYSLTPCQKEAYEKARAEGKTASKAYELAVGSNPLKPGVEHGKDDVVVTSRYQRNIGVKNNNPNGYSRHDISIHRILKKQRNRAFGNRNIKADNHVQSHHIIQNEWAMRNVPGYNQNAAPIILLQTGIGLEHTHISNAQNRRREQLGFNTNIRDEFDFSYRSMIEAGIDRKTAQRAIRESYRYFNFLGVV